MRPGLNCSVLTEQWPLCLGPLDLILVSATGPVLALIEF